MKINKKGLLYVDSLKKRLRKTVCKKYDLKDIKRIEWLKYINSNSAKIN